jgi:hypothetical protein
MEARLSECTISVQRAVIRFLWAEGIKPCEIHRRTLVPYGDKCIGQRKVYEWVERFKNGRKYVTGEDRSGRPVTSSSVTNVDRVFWNMERLLMVKDILPCLKTSWNLLFAVNGEDCCQKQFFRIMTMLDRLPPLQQSRNCAKTQFRDSSSSALLSRLGSK